MYVGNKINQSFLLEFLLPFSKKNFFNQQIFFNRPTVCWICCVLLTELLFAAAAFKSAEKGVVEGFVDVKKLLLDWGVCEGKGGCCSSLIEDAKSTAKAVAADCWGIDVDEEEEEGNLWEEKCWGDEESFWESSNELSRFWKKEKM